MLSIESHTRGGNQEINMLNSMRRFLHNVPPVVFALTLAIALGGCAGEGSVPESTPSEERSVSIEIECESNLILSRYDLDVYIDGEHQGSLDHGTNKAFDAKLGDGDHDLRITKKDDDGVDGSVGFSVSGDTSLKYKVKCTSSQVEIEAIEEINPPISSGEASSTYHDEAHRAFEDAGFTNIREEELRDLTPNQRSRNWYTTSIEINGNGDFDKDDAFHADDEVLITYHVLADLNPPASSSELTGRSYEEVVDQFEQAGFINVTTKKTTASGAEGAVSEVRIGGIFGSTDFSSSDTFAFDAGVEIAYYEGNSASEASETPDPVPDSEVQALITSSDTNAGWFSSSYKGRTITFDGWVADLQHHGSYDTRWDVLILAGNYGDGRGPNFRLTDVGFSDMRVTNADTLRSGDNITITAVVGEYNSTSDWLELDPVSISIR